MSLANLKKGDTVVLHMFTGLAVGVKEVLEADKSTVTLETRIGKAKFSKKTGRQIEPKAKQDRFANYIEEDDGSFETADGKQEKKTKKAKKSTATEKAAPKKRKKKKADPEPEPEEIDEEEYQEETDEEE